MKKTIIAFDDIRTCLEKHFSDGFIYYILDAAQVSEQASQFLNRLRSRPEVDFYSLFAGTVEGNVPFEASPILIVILDQQILDEHEFRFMHEVWEKKFALNIVFSPLKLHSFSKKMKRYLTVEMPDGDHKLFRWFDPRIIKKLDKILEEDQEQEFFSDISKWLVSIRNYEDIDRNNIMILENE